MKPFLRVAWSALLLVTASGTSVRAEVRELTIAKLYGLTHVQMMIMESEKLIEKHARASGLGEVSVSWVTLGGASAINDALLSGRVQFAAGGVGALATIWDKTRKNLDVRGVCALNSMPVLLNTRDPKVRSIKDLQTGDKIALPAVKVSYQAQVLQMAAARAFGDANYQKLDTLTVSMAHPDGMTAILSGAGEVNNHFTAPPYQYIELEKPGVRTILSSYDVLGGPTTLGLIMSTETVRRENPKIYRAFLDAVKEATDLINRNKRQAAEHYVAMTKEKVSIDQVLRIINDPAVEFTLTPKNVLPFVQFMHRIGQVKEDPKSWKDLFFPEIHDLQGS